MVLDYRVRMAFFFMFNSVVISEITGLPGQIKLKRSSVVVVGAGGLGCPALQYLAAAGIGEHILP